MILTSYHREDALFRKQQIKDELILKQYESELRDPTEFLMWQKNIQNEDKQKELDTIIQRKIDIKQSHISAYNSKMNKKQNNYDNATLQRMETDFLIKQKDMDNEIIVLNNQLLVQNLIDIRENKPKEAVERELEIRIEKGKLVR